MQALPINFCSFVPATIFSIWCIIFATLKVEQNKIDKGSGKTMIYKPELSKVTLIIKLFKLQPILAVLLSSRHWIKQMKNIVLVKLVMLKGMMPLYFRYRAHL